MDSVQSDLDDQGCTLIQFLAYYCMSGGWWRVKEFEDILGQICIEMNPHSYVKALDNGLFVVGPPHPEGMCFSCFEGN